MSDATQQAAVDFVEHMGRVAQGDGLPRIAGRIFGLLLLMDDPQTFAELAGKLQVSRGSISTNTRLLEQLGLIERIGRPGERQDYFQLRDDPYAHLLKGIVNRTERALEGISSARRNIAGGGATAERLRLLERFYGQLAESAEQLASDWMQTSKAKEQV